MCTLYAGTLFVLIIFIAYTNLLSIFPVEPSEPINVTIESFGSTWISASWLEPIFTGVPTFSQFIVSAVPTNAMNGNSLAVMPPRLVTVEVLSTVLHANITTLFPGEEYSLSVVAVSEAHGLRINSNSSAMVLIITHTTGNALLLKFILYMGFYYVLWSYQIMHYGFCWVFYSLIKNSSIVQAACMAILIKPHTHTHHSNSP